ncbi:hypothetical protein FNU76_21690 [Chitinimonas arctica]|uniref:Uncharacterized protein n=1 Tax=Chitinimonas arctica TaxID=2594795 RepID=A0A516SKR2_9NEIS|nr:hypothetical protein [Chitinimonas arctica]QDQ28752.1 hypothetical protein FNU76_21690 [Chitinimonas arctica]
MASHTAASVEPRVVGCALSESDRTVQGLEKVRDRLKANPEEARAFLRKLGIIKADGHLTKRFGG